MPNVDDFTKELTEALNKDSAEDFDFVTGFSDESFEEWPYGDTDMATHEIQFIINAESADNVFGDAGDYQSVYDYIYDVVSDGHFYSPVDAEIRSGDLIVTILYSEC